MTQQQKSETKISRNNLQSLFALDKTSKMQQAGSIPLRFRLLFFFWFSSSPVSNLSIPAEKCSTINCVHRRPCFPTWNNKTTVKGVWGGRERDSLSVPEFRHPPSFSLSFSVFAGWMGRNQYISVLFSFSFFCFHKNLTFACQKTLRVPVNLLPKGDKV